MPNFSVRTRLLRAAACVVFIAGAVTAELAPAVAQARTSVVRPGDAPAVIAQLQASSATAKAAQISADQEINELRQKIDRLSRAAQRAPAGAEAERLSRELAAAQADFVNKLAARDAEYARMISEFRTNVVQLASIPEAAVILGARARGDLAPARQQLDALIRKRQTPKDQYVANLRALAALAIDDRGFSEATTRELIGRFEELTELDPKSTTAWAQLAKLYRESGNLTLAGEAAAKAGGAAGNDWDRGEAFAIAADLAAERGDYKAMIDAARKSVEFRRKAAGGGDLAALRNLSQTLLKLADAEFRSGDYLKARPVLEDSLGVARQLVALNPSSRDLKRDESVILRMLGFAQFSLQNIDAGIKAATEAKAIQAALVAAEPKSEPLLTEYFESLRLMSGLGPYTNSQAMVAAMSKGNADSPEARKVLADSELLVQIAERRVAIDPASSGYQRDLVQARNSLAQMQMFMGGSAGALQAATANAAAASRTAKANAADGSFRVAAEQSIDTIRSSYLLAAVRLIGSNNAEAVRTLDQGITAARKGVQDTGGAREWQLLLADLLKQKAAFVMIGGSTDYGASIAAANEQKTILQKLLAAEPNNQDLKKRLEEATKTSSQLSMMSAYASNGAGSPTAGASGNSATRQAARDFRRNQLDPAEMAALTGSADGMRQLEAALAAAQKQAGAGDPGPEWGDVLSRAYFVLSSVHYQRKEYAKASARANDRVVLLEKLAKAYPTEGRAGNFVYQLKEAQSSANHMAAVLKQPPQ